MTQGRDTADLKVVGMDGGQVDNTMSGTATNMIQARDIAAIHIGGVALPIPHQLPPDIAPFVDREVAIEGLHSWLGESDSGVRRHVVVAGAGGVGKTALATHWAHQVRDRFPDGELYIDLRGYHPQDSLSTEEALNELLCAFLPTERIPLGLGAKIGLYRSLLNERRILLLLDNAASPDQVRPLLPGAPTCRVLITSRSRLSALTTGEDGRPMPVDVLPPDRAVDLLRRVAGAERLDGAPAAAAELARLCGFLPLALRIIANRLAADPFQGVSDLVEELIGERDRLDGLIAEDDGSASVRAVFSWSYRILAPAAARMFRLLSLPAGGELSLAAAATLADVPPAEARRLLSALVGAHLVNEVGPRRYGFHDLLRLYSAECSHKDDSPTDRHAALRRYLDWTLNTAEAAGRVLYPHQIRSPLDGMEISGVTVPLTDAQQARVWLDEERTNLVAAVRQAAEVGEHGVAWRLPVALFGYFVVGKSWDDWIASFEIGLAAAQVLADRAAEAWLLTGVAVPHLDLGQFDIAADYFGLALAAWRDTGQEWGELWALRDLGETLRRQGRFAESVGYLESALEIAVRTGDRNGESDTRVYLAEAYCGLGRLAEALDCARAALAISAENARVLLTLSRVHRDLKQFDQALDHAGTAFEIWHRYNYRHGEAVIHNDIGEILQRLGRDTDARAHWTAALEIFEELDDPEAEKLRSLLNSDGG
ncbi:MAG TPA: tetratricopeptide repeat protein [Pseudonocardiaceae bacterium]|nr:tetratricopeptide repeat protein [Pseudonocardiaceae bacterium]